MCKPLVDGTAVLCGTYVKTVMNCCLVRVMSSQSHWQRQNGCHSLFFTKCVPLFLSSPTVLSHFTSHYISKSPIFFSFHRPSSPVCFLSLLNRYRERYSLYLLRCLSFLFPNLFLIKLSINNATCWAVAFITLLKL